jgi:hypothetical protein
LCMYQVHPRDTKSRYHLSGHNGQSDTSTMVAIYHTTAPMWPQMVLDSECWFEYLPCSGLLSTVCDMEILAHQF